MDNNTPENKLESAENISDEVKDKKKKKEKTPPKMSDMMRKMNRTLKIQTAWILILSIAVIGLAGCVFSDILVYNYAKICINSGNIERGVELLNSIPHYSATADLLDQYKYTVKGNIIRLGTYEQDGDTGNGSEALEWIVLDYDAEEKKALIMTLYAIDCVVYKDSYGAVTWETSDARRWLNRDFIRKAFKGNELGMIIESDIETPNNSKYNTKGGNVTADQVFLLSDEEFNKYLKGTEHAIGYTTQYARDNGVQSGPISGTSVCWLRSPGESLVYVSTVSYVGELNSMGVYSYSYSCGVRPAMWVNVGE
ncbi:MAG: hypothetical protein IJZ89_07740 [Clostridia bacterium]|nr:hypothetical protein [Clostridia bacterium]